MERLIKHVLDTLADLGDSEQVALFSIHDTGYTGEIVGGFNQGEFLSEGKIISFKDTPMEQVIKSKQSNTFVGKMYHGLPFPAYVEEVEVPKFECLCLPLLDDNEQILGVAILTQKIGISKPDYRIQTLTMLRTLIAAAMENARLFQLATTDSLTGLYVRRYFEIRLQEEITRLKRHGEPVSLLMVDIDHFKQVNDIYGHQQGDLVLRELACLLSSCIRSELDLPCRYGGEEFIILLPNTDESGARILAQRILEQCDSNPFTTFNGEALHVTVSIGVATNKQHCAVDKIDFIENADKALYQAKNSGRNQVTVYTHN